MKTIKNKKYIEKNDLSSNFYGLDQYKPGNKSTKNLVIPVTSGTTSGKPTMVVRNFIISKKMLRFYKFSKPTLAITPKNWIWLAMTQVYLFKYAKSNTTMFLTKKDIENPSIVSAIGEFEPRVIYSFVSMLNFFIEKTNVKKNNFNKKIENVYLSGETPSATFSTKTKKKYPKSDLGTTYGLSEVGMIGLSCKDLTKKRRGEGFEVYHINKKISIINKDKNDVGEISVSTKELPNYLTGDSGKILREKCKCGAKETLLVYGRMNYDIVNCVGATFHIIEVERVFSLIRNYVDDYYIEIREVERKGKTVGSLTVNIVPTKKLTNLKSGQEFVSKFIEKNLQLTKTRLLKDLVNEEIFLPTEIVFVPSLPNKSKKIRMRKIIS